MHYIGMDCHITTLEFAVVNDAGRLIKADRVATSAKGFMEFVKKQPLPRTIYMEEGTLAKQDLARLSRTRYTQGPLFGGVTASEATPLLELKELSLQSSAMSNL